MLNFTNEELEEIKQAMIDNIGLDSNRGFNFLISNLYFFTYYINHSTRYNEVNYSYIIDNEKSINDLTINCKYCNALLNLIKHYDPQENIIKCYDCKKEDDWILSKEDKKIISEEKISIEKNEFKLIDKYTITNKGVVINYNQKYIKWPLNSKENYYNLTVNLTKDEKIGNGMTGSIFKKQLKNGEFVSIKIYDPENKDFEKDIEKFKRCIERELIIQLESTLIYKSLYIIPLKYVYKVDKKIYFINEYMNEGDLSKVIEKYHNKLMDIKDKNPFEMEKIIFTIIYQIAQGLLELNANFKTLHFDLKPDNILINEFGMVKLIDFGVSRMNKHINSDEYFGKKNNINVNKIDKRSSPYDPKNEEEENIVLSKINESVYLIVLQKINEMEKIILNQKYNSIKLNPQDLKSFYKIQNNILEGSSFDLRNLDPFTLGPALIKAIFDLMGTFSKDNNLKPILKEMLIKLKSKYQSSLIQDNSLIYLQNENQNRNLYKFDIFSLGVILYFLLVGNQDLAYSLKCNIYEDPEDNEYFFEELKKVYSLSDEFIKFLKGCLCYDVNKRFDILQVINSEWFKIQILNGGLDENWLYKLKGINKKNLKYENFRVREIIKLKNSIPSKVSINKKSFIFNGNEIEINLSFNSLNQGWEDLGKVDFKNLITLNLSGNSITDVSCLANGNILSNLKILDLSANKICNIDFLLHDQTSQLEAFSLNNNIITDENMQVFNFITFEKLFFLDLGKNKIKNIYFLTKGKYQKLELLNLSYNKIENIEILSDKNFPSKALKYISLKNNRIVNIMCLNNIHFENLEVLNLDYNKINKVFEFKKEFYPKLRILNLFSNKIEDILPLKRIMLDLPCIKYVFLLKNPTTADSLQLIKAISIDFNKISLFGTSEIIADTLYFH